jgi:quinol monooxygenase YgiN
VASRITLSSYRARDGHADEVLPHLRDEIAALRARGHITSRRAAICRTASGEFLVVSEWSTERAVDDAHEDEAILEIWRRKEQLVEYLAPGELAGSDVPFASFDLIEDA